MNDTAATYPRPGVWLGDSSLLFVGHLPPLDWHAHPFACVLLSPAGSITVETHSGPRSAGVVFAAPGVRHRLAFTATPTLSLYVAPHEHDFAALRHAAPRDAAVAARDAVWDAAWRRWRDAHDATPLRDALRATFAATPAPPRDHRVTRLLRALSRGDHLKSSPRELAATAGLSASRLMHLIKSETGSPLGALQRGYRFWRAARAMIDDVTFTRAAHEADFADAAHFSRAFRQAYGLAPTGILGMHATWAREPTVG